VAATKERSSPTRRARGASAAPTKNATRARKAAAQEGKSAAKHPARATAKGAKKAAHSGARKVSDAVKPSGVRHPIRRIAVSAALKGLKLIGRKALDAAGDTVRSAADRAAAAGKDALDSGLSRRLPIQVAVDVAVPLQFAWEEWMTFENMTEGVHRIEDVERDGDRLYGKTAAPLSADWEAEIVDEREQQSFAWRSVQGSDCAGLATFHRLSERLTRIELDLDVLPTRPGETLTLSLHLAHRRAENELRRFKARLEFINPDVYEADLSQNGNAPTHESDE
jgi:uncharacterized membrane protein